MVDPAEAIDHVDEDLESLTGLLVPLGHDLLGKRGPLMPFGAAVYLDGHTRLIGTEERSSFGSLQVLIDGMRANRNTYRAVGLAADARLAGTRRDVFTVHFEYFDHNILVCIKLLYPYTRSRFKHSIAFEGRSGQGAEPLIWKEEPPTLSDAATFAVDR